MTTLKTRTEVDSTGVTYTVECITGWVLWETRILFGNRPSNRAGGSAFVQAAREQERQFAQLSKQKYV